MGKDCTGLRETYQNHREVDQKRPLLWSLVQAPPILWAGLTANFALGAWSLVVWVLKISWDGDWTSSSPGPCSSCRLHSGGFSLSPAGVSLLQPVVGAFQLAVLPWEGLALPTRALLWERPLWKLHEQKKEQGVASRKVTVLNSCLQNASISSYQNGECRGFWFLESWSSSGSEGNSVRQQWAKSHEAKPSGLQQRQVIYARGVTASATFVQLVLFSSKKKR